MYIEAGEGIYLSVFFYEWNRPLEDGVPAPPAVFHKSKREKYIIELYSIPDDHTDISM